MAIVEENEGNISQEDKVEKEMLGMIFLKVGRREGPSFHQAVPPEARPLL